MIKNFLPLCCFILCLCQSVPAQEMTSLDVDEELTRRVNEYIKPYVDTGNFSGVILVGRDNKIVVYNGFGFANFEHNVATTRETKYPLASVGKQFSAVSIMQLAERGNLSVNDPLKKCFPEFKHDKITLHHLLTHASGLQEIPPSNENYSDGEALQHNIESLNKMNLSFAPGSGYQYLNTNYYLLSEVVKKVSGKEYQDYIRDHVLQPLSMKETFYDQGLPIPGRATGHYLFHNGPVLAVYYRQPFPGALYMTAGDLFKFVRGIATASLVSEKSRDQMYTAHNGFYGYAHNILDINGNKAVWHGGTGTGYRSTVYFHLGSQITVIFFSNIFNCPVRKIVSDVAQLASGVDVAIPETHHRIILSEQYYSRIAGYYKSSDADLIKISLVSGKPIVEFAWQKPAAYQSNSERFSLLSESVTAFFIPDSMETLIFPGNENERASRLIYKNSVGDEIRFKRFNPRMEKLMQENSGESDFQRIQ